MELLNRYRNITVLLLVIFAQLVLLGYQVRSNQDIRLIRVWAVTAVTPLAKGIESVRSTAEDSVGKYFSLHNVADENRRLKEEIGKLKLENQYLRSELSSADRAAALATFQRRNPSKMIPARVIGTGTSANSRVVFIDRGTPAGVQRGMAVITPDGIVGKVIASFPTAAQVLLVTDPNFNAGVISQKHHVRGIVRGTGQSKCSVDDVENEEKVDQGEWFYTSGDDGVFPKGLPVGYVSAVRDDSPKKSVTLAPSGLQGGLEEVLVILEGVHLPIPDETAPAGPVHLQPPPPPEPGALEAKPADAATGTEADRLRARYRRIGEAQNHKFGESLPGSRPVDFNMDPDKVKPAIPPAATPATPGGQPSAPEAASPKPSGASPGAPTLAPKPVESGTVAKPAAVKPPTANTPAGVKPSPVKPQPPKTAAPQSETQPGN